MRRTKIVCTIGPKTNTFEKLLQLAEAGMNIVRLNMSHGTHEWHGDVIKAVKRINNKYEYSLALMLDTKGPELRSGDLKADLDLATGDKFTLTTKSSASYPPNTTSINYDKFIEDVDVNDVILIDGGVMSMKVVEKTDIDIVCEVIDGGKLGSRRHLNIKGKSAKLPSITEKDWEDIKFGADNGVDYIALSFVNEKEGVLELRKYLDENKLPIDIISKIESIKAVENLEEIIEVSDGLMVARGDLGSEMSFEEVPLVQDRMVELCRASNKPVIVATQLLESMMVYPTPTRAEITDISVAVKSKADAIMLSGETAVGKYPVKAVGVMDTTARKIEEYLLQKNEIELPLSDRPRREIVRSAAIMANNINAKAILVFTRSGYMASLVSQARPQSLIFAFTNTSHVRRRLNLYWGVRSFRIKFSRDPEKTIDRAFELLTASGQLEKDDTVVVVSDILVEEKYINTIQVRKV